jgi:hypothetical protein
MVTELRGAEHALFGTPSRRKAVKEICDMLAPNEFTIVDLRLSAPMVH